MKKLSIPVISLLIVLIVIFTSHKECKAQLMSVNNPAYLQGTVSDFNDGSPIANVTVTAMAADTFFTETAANGTYNLTVDEDTYDVYFELIGLKTVIVSDTFAAEGITTTISVSTSEEPYPVPWVFADPNQADTEIYITWGEPEGPHEIIYEDGNAEDFFMWAQTAAASAVRFTPNGYPATVEGGRVFVGDGSFPSGADFLGEEFSIGVLDDDGPDGLPGTVLDSITVTVNNYYWVEFEGLNITFDSGDFYLVMWQLETPPQAAPIGVDTDVPTIYRSYVAQNGSSWSASLYQDFMIRATVNGPNENNSIDDYRLIWIDNFDPDAGEGPEDGYWHHRVYHSGNSYNDLQWGFLPPGFYAWGVKVYYDSGDTSVWTYSNIVAHLLDNEVTISVNLSNDSTPGSVDILMVGNNYPYQEFEGVATVLPGDTIAEMLVDSAIDGLYDLHVSSPGFEDYVITDVDILNDSILLVEMQETTFPARNLFVHSLTSVATWDIPLITQLPKEDFEDELFPPEGWDRIDGIGGFTWIRDNEGTFTSFWPPPGDGYYAICFSSVGPTATDVYLITPALDLRQSPNFTLNFDHYFTGAWGSDAAVKYSTDSCQSWEVLTEISPVNGYAWESLVISLSQFSGVDSMDKIWFAFFFTDHGMTGSGWAVDNVSVTAGPASSIGYYVYLDDALVGETSAEDTTYTFQDLVYGETYKATVKAQYSSGLSEPIDYYWTSGYLYPPRELSNTYLANSDQIPLYWLPPMIIDSIREKSHRIHPKFSIENNDSIYGHVPDSLIGFKVYQDGQWIADVAYDGEGVNDTIQFITASLDPACYAFTVSAIYDLTAFGFPGEEGESMLEGPDTVCVVWGNELPFIEAWDEGGFAINGWRLDGDGWLINTEIGNPQPSAEFKAELIFEDSTYSSTLTSNPLVANQLFTGDIFLDFNMKLENINETSEEKLLVEITNDAGKTWIRVAEIWNNDDIGFEDGFHHVNITAQAMGKVFHIRFKATGINPTDIESWFIDNIHVYRSCAAPTDLVGSYVWSGNDWGAEIKWNAPELPHGCGMWLYWDNEVYAGGVGLTDGGTWSLAQRWDAGQLKNWQGIDLTGSQISKMMFVLNDDGFESITLKIWSGPNAGTLLCEQEVINPIIGEWLIVTLDEPVFFDTDEELWIGYTITNQPAGMFPGGYDEGPAVPGYGDMISTDGITWDLISEFGIDNNWVVHAFPGPSGPSPSSDINGFNLFRQEVEVDDDYILYDFIDFTEEQNAYEYFDKFPAVISGQTYNYQVTTKWVAETDTCESVPALTINMFEDYVSILVTELENLEAGEISLFPNPATHSLNISSTNPIERISVFNYVGQLVFDREMGGDKTVTMNTASFESGIYVLRIDTGGELINRRVVISK